MTTEAVLLRDVITIPTEVHQGDLVFRLADAADDPAATVQRYVVTEQLQQAFLDAVALVRSAVTDQSSKAAYLHGSFGSGKSNFMGMLQLLLDGNPAARAAPELAPVVDDIDQWRGDRKFLTVPFHLIGETDLESAVFGQYVTHVAKTHPDAPLPAVFADEPILENADSTRARVGDDAFFATLSEGAATDSGWGDLAAGWTAATYDAARHAPHGSAERIRLVQALTSTWLSSYGVAARANRSGYVGFADGLSAISYHAQSLGYAGVILFLDELILWFLSHLADLPWVTTEASKLSKLVEAASASRPVPIISIIARQRDLRELVGDSVPGADALSFADQLSYQEGRFSTIHLDDSNLPVVANRRLLAPRDPAAAGVLREAFASLALSAPVRDALLADHGDDASFALTYPFSPAFMTVLVDVAGALQRTRTGLRVLLELLVAERDELEVGHLVPVGDLYDVIANSDDPFSEAMRAAFDQARKIYDTRLRPALLAEHNLTEGDEPTPAFRADDRLVKTLLLAALVPQSTPFKDLTVARLVALNHGVISSPVPGQETAIVANKLQRLASHVGELRLGSDPSNPTVTIVLSDVDTGAILATADGADNTAARRTLVRELVLRALSLPVDQMAAVYSILWKGLRREVALTFGNIRDAHELPDAVFANDGPGWKVVIDFPFDDGHTPLEDLERLDRFVQNGASWFTLAWLPSFFTVSTLDALGRLVRLNHVLANEDRFADATSSLSPVARAAAKPQLEAMQATTRSQIEAALLGAYGVVNADERTVDRSHDLASHFPSLRAGLTIQPPTTPSLQGALEQVLDQALRHTYPAAPDLGSDGAEVRAADVRKIAALCSDAVIEPDGRLRVNDAASRRLLVRIANPLRLGVQSEQAFTLQQTAEHWDQRFTQAIHRARQDGIPVPTVELLRAAMNQPEPMGVTVQLENLVILVWAQATSHTFEEHGGPAAATVDRLLDTWTVVEQDLPTDEVWAAACDRLAAVFGVTLPTRQLSGFALERAGLELAKAAVDHGPAVAALADRLADWNAEFAPGADGARLATARVAKDLIDVLAAASTDLERVRALAAAEIRPSDVGLGRSITRAATVANALDGAQREIIRTAASRAGGDALHADLARALDADEIAIELVPALEAVQQRAIAALSGDGPTPPPPPPPGQHRWTGAGIGAALQQLEALREKLRQQVIAEDDVEVTIELARDWPDRDGRRIVVTVRSATPALVEQRVVSLLEQRPDTACIALRAEPVWRDGDLYVAERRVHVTPCPSPLAVRASLAEWSATDRGTGPDVLVVLCGFDESETLGDDVLARVAQARIIGLDPWRAAMRACGATELDAGFGREDGWIADALLALAPPSGGRPVAAGGVLTLDGALDALSRSLLGAERLDVDAVLRAAAEPSPFSGLDGLVAEWRDPLLGALAERNGPLGGLVAAILAAGRGPELLAIGLAARAVYGRGDRDGGRAAGRLEARCGEQTIAPTVGAALASRAEELVTTLFETDVDRANEIVAAASALQRHFEATDSIESDVLPDGFELRVRAVSETLIAILDAVARDEGALVSDLLAALRSERDRVVRHRVASTPSGTLRAEHVDMAARLAAWIATPITARAQSFEDAACEFARDGAWVDRARRRLWRGDSDPEVGDAYRALLDAVVQRRQVENGRFAELLASWSEAPADAGALASRGLVKIEDVLGEVVAPLARTLPAVVVLLDGCGLPSFVELAPQFRQAGFREIVRDDPGDRWTGIAALPTVTEVSRASFFAGYPDQGGQEHERRRFGARTDLGASPQLFHQNRLTGAAGSSLAPAVEESLAGPSVVGVVVNTIDDQLKRGDFTAIHVLQDLHALPWILAAARERGRAVVVCADHGHVLAQPADGGTGTSQRGGEGGERWRVADRKPEANEVLLRGPRVLLGGESGVIAPWDDDFRYGAKAGGYHGGATPEEVLVPVAVFVPAGIDPPEGWEAWSDAPPVWWDARLDPVDAGREAAPAPRTHAARGRTLDQPGLFEEPSIEPEPVATPTVQGEPAWVAALLASEVWKLQRGTAPRAALPEDRVRAVLTALMRRGGVASFGVVAGESEIPLTRLPGFLAVLARVLNVDGYAVLEVEAASQEARLSPSLLAQQFEIELT